MARSKKDTSAPPTAAAGDDQIVTLSGMYQNYFLDYASYVILERAVPAIEDGLKPVQRRILHAMYEQHDGRYHKVANLIGQTMQYHPHGDAAIGDALVNLGQKDLLIDCQGNWGDYRTGDPAAAPRYIEARLTKFALEVAFNPQTTHWQMSYDGRKREPITLPMKFPLLLAQGVEGIAVGLSTKVLPHNFIELCQASIAVLEGREANLYPDFPTGGLVDVTQYNAGARGGKVRIRARIQEVDKKTLRITELPYGVFVGDLIDSILKANEKGQIKIKRVTDKTAAEVDIEIELQPGVSPDVTIDALYAFTDCEISISPNCCVIQGSRPLFTDVNELLRISTENTKELLRQELEILRRELEEKLHFASLEKIFIEKRIYRDIEECETWDAVLQTIETGLRKYVITPDDPDYRKKTDKIKLLRTLTQDDLVRLTEIRIKRISKYNSFKADEEIAQLNEQLRETLHHLEHLTDYAIAYFRRLLEKYGAGRERKTEIAVFDEIRAAEVVANNAKLYVDRAGGFIGYGLKKDEFIQDCSDIDDIIVFRRDGVMKVVRIGEKVFVGKDIIHAAVWKKNDERTTYNLAYVDGKTGRTMVKRFNVTAITRDKEYPVGGSGKGSRILYLTANPNGESEVVTVTLSPGCSAKIKVFDYDFAELAIKGRDAQGNILTKYPVKSIRQKEVGKSTIGAQKIWYDDITGRLNTQERGRLLGEFDTGDQLLVLYRDGTYEQTDTDLLQRFEPKDVLYIGKFHPDTVISAVHFDGHKGWTMVKRFRIETARLRERFTFITDHPKSKLLFASVKPNPRIQYTLRVKGKSMSGEISLGDFMDVKGWKAVGNKLSDVLLSDIQEVDSDAVQKPAALVATEPTPQQGTLFDTQPNVTASGDKETSNNRKANNGKATYKAGDTIEFD
ncbi:MAG: DNA gyrase/topoisomerase IV subunit A [Saprospiraceae bacterium]|nr:DNA gyrase/topoisomerase IV subunit A [Saprospiraceae bacterium]MDW8228910.1 DNA gyrase/topoisomerase IV subunit A [Saprospiraceae bacterium]